MTIPESARAALVAHLTGPDAVRNEELIASAAWDAASYADAAARVLAICGRDCTATAAQAALSMSASEHFDATDTGRGTRQRDAERATRLERLDQIVQGCTSGALVCRRCRGDNIAIQQKQTRSADEGMTIFCKCDTCGAQWRMS